MVDRLDRDGLRAAVYGADVAVLVDALNGDLWPENALQLMGEAVLVAARARAAGIASSSRRCASGLRDRGWEGDRELAGQVDAVLGFGPASVLRPLRVNLEDLAGVLEGDPLAGGGWIELQTGEVWPQAVLEYAEQVGELDPDQVDDRRWLEVVCEGSRAAYRDVEMFVDFLEDVRVADRLARAIRGRGAFRRFKVALTASPGLLGRWYGFSDDRQRGRARAWLAAEGYSATPPTTAPEP